MSLKSYVVLIKETNEEFKFSSLKEARSFMRSERNSKIVRNINQSLILLREVRKQLDELKIENSFGTIETLF